MKQKHWSSALFLTTCIMLTGCKVGPDYHPPKNDIPDAWRQEKPMTAEPRKETDATPQHPAPLDQKAIAELEWWKQFNDPVLNDLIVKGLAQNFDLKIAQAHIKGARAQLAAARSALLPEVDMDAHAEREANLIAFGSTTIPKPFNIFQAGFDATWELDFFGKNRRTLESFEALFGATRADLDEVRVTLLAEIARTYINIRNYQTQVAIAADLVKEEEGNVKIREELFKAGSTNETDLIHAKTAAEQAHSQLLAAQNILTNNEYALDLLLAEKPGTAHELLAEVKPVPIADKALVMAAPATVIANRPDIRAAERRLAASVSQIGATEAELFPNVSLSSFFGLFNPVAHNLFKPESKAWDLGASLNWPILNFGRISADVKYAKSQKEEALLTYKKSVLSALVDVENSLSAYSKQEETRALMDKSVTENQHGLDIATMRHKAGMASYIEVLDAQRILYGAQSQAAAATAASSQDMIAVYKSLGGGWEKNTQPKAQATQPQASEPTPATPAATAAPAAPEKPVPSEAQAAPPVPVFYPPKQQ